MNCVSGKIEGKMEKGGKALRTQKVSRKIELPGTELLAVIEAERNGQCPPSESDQIRVKGRILLPVSDRPTSLGEESSYLHQALRFECRVKVMCENLTRVWGDPHSEGQGRYRETVEFGEKWEEAIQALMESLESQVKPLVDALEARQQALLDAED